MNHDPVQKSKAMPGLIVLNAALLLVLAAITFSSDLFAQSVSRGEYICVSGNIQGSNIPVTWILNQSTQELVAMSYDKQKRQFTGLGYRNITTDAQTGAR